MEYISDRIKALTDSQTLAMAQKGRELKAKGIDVISLSLGEPDFDTPQYIKDAAKKAIDDNYTRYPPVPGYPELLKAISAKFKNENNLSYTPEQIIVSAGGKHSLANIILTLINPDDEVIIPAPYWVSYLDQVLLAGGKPVIISATLESDFKITPSQLSAAITSKTRLFIFNSPSNPTGMVYTKEEITAIAEVIKKHEGLFIISDEIYEHIIFEGEHVSIAALPGMYDKVITVNGVSKGYAMTGWRIGYIGAPLWIAKAINKLQGQLTSGVCSIAQLAALAAVSSDDGSRKKMREAFMRRRDLLCGLMKDLHGLKLKVPQGAFYLMPDISYFLGKSFEGTTIKTSDDLALYLLDKAQVALVGGDGFGAPECIRISYATSDDLLVEAVKRIKKALEQLS